MANAWHKVSHSKWLTTKWWAGIKTTAVMIGIVSQPIDRPVDWSAKVIDHPYPILLLTASLLHVGVVFATCTLGSTNSTRSSYIHHDAYGFLTVRPWAL